MCLKPLLSCTDTRSVVFLWVKMCQVCLLAHCQPQETDGKLLFWKWTQPVLRCFSLIAVDYTLRIVATSFHETRLIFLYCYQYFHLSIYLPTYLGHDVSSRTLACPGSALQPPSKTCLKTLTWEISGRYSTEYFDILLFYSDANWQWYDRVTCHHCSLCSCNHPGPVCTGSLYKGQIPLTTWDHSDT